MQTDTISKRCIWLTKQKRVVLRMRSHRLLLKLPLGLQQARGAGRKYSQKESD